jgi:hypothetical protein
MCAKCAHDFKPPRATARLYRRRATPLADISNGRLDYPLRDPTGATGADQCRAVGSNGDCRVLRLSRHSRNTRHHVSRMRCSAERLRSGAPLIRDRHGLERSGSAAHHFVLRCARDTKSRALPPGHAIGCRAPAFFPPTKRIFYLTTIRSDARTIPSLPECGARRGVLRRAVRNRAPREARDPALQALRPGCEELAVTDPAQMPVREARPREPKTATVERREASVPRHKRVHARL